MSLINRPCPRPRVALSAAASIVSSFPNERHGLRSVLPRLRDATDGIGSSDHIDCWYIYRRREEGCRIYVEFYSRMMCFRLYTHCFINNLVDVARRRAACDVQGTCTAVLLPLLYHWLPNFSPSVVPAVV